MFIYSKKIIYFINEIKTTIKQILSKEIQLKVAGNRFYDKRLETSYPIKVVIFNNKAMLGYFERTFYELGFHEVLMHQPKEKLDAIIRHEIAHYMTFINHPYAIHSHGVEFRTFCERMKWGEEVYKATSCLSGAEDIVHLEESPIFRKVQKLMALATSHNTNEAELAMIKSQQLLLKHNLEFNYRGVEDDERVVLKRILKEKRSSPKTDAIGRILETFFVSIVYSRHDGCSYLEVLGTQVNVEIAEYVAHFLENELEKLWNDTRKSSPYLKGQVAKNSFFTGLALGYCNKVEALKREHTNETKNALIALKNKLIEAQSMVYERLSSKSSQRGYCQESSQRGQQAGKQLQINPGLKSPSFGGRGLIGY